MTEADIMVIEVDTVTVGRYVERDTYIMIISAVILGSATGLGVVHAERVTADVHPFAVITPSVKALVAH